MELLIRGGAPGRDGTLISVTPQRANWRYVGFEAVRLASGATRTWKLSDREACVVLLGGRCELRAGGKTLDASDGRASPFDGPPRDVGAELAIGSAPATTGAPVQIFRPSDARLEIRGSGTMERRIHHLLMEDRDAERLLLTEVVTPAGHWSSYPPHKHDTNDPPRETALEETYYHRLRDERGFALQRVYTADRSLDESLAPRDGECVLVPRGYHTVSAAPGYELYYLNVMAGPLRQWNVTFDPDHRRLLG
jgi:5-deoxy-glucuronate isomerase